MINELIYLDNAATSRQKPETVYLAVDKALREQAGNPGRSGHRLSLSAARVLDNARLFCSRLFNAQKTEQIVFTQNATIALNMILKGILKPGDHVITSSLEHNAVVRPLHRLQQNGILISKVPTDIDHGIQLDRLEQNITNKTKLIICNHFSNVFGTVNKIDQIGRFCRERGILFAVDAAQSAGCRKIDVQEMCIDFLAFAGHKSLFGPQGTGGFYLRPGLQLETIIEGGTGNHSELPEQPEQLPERFETGTPNTPGLAGLTAGIQFILETGIDNIATKETLLVNRLLAGLDKIPKIRVIAPKPESEQGPIVSVQLEKFSPEQAASILDSSFGIAVRSGLHCAADAHRFMNTLENGGTLRISPNYFNENKHIDYCLDALQKLS
jgi:cysteine desulfurase family protein